jgi:hypothetical protein
MSDYVSRLVARSMGAAHVVRPETGSLFEPRDAAPPHFLAEVDVETSTPPRASRGERHAPAGDADDLAVDQAEDPRPAPTNRVAPRDPGTPPVDEAPAPALATFQEPVEPAETDAPEGAERTTAILDQAEARKPRAASATPESRTSRARPTSLGTLSMLPSDSRVPAPDEPPVVQVTIGRVDVRAVQSPRPVPPARAPDREPEGPPRQTLGEYLRKGARP